VKEISQIAVDQEALEKRRYECQEKMWDKFLFPCMSVQESDQKELETTDKRVRNTFSKLDSQLKKVMKKKASNSNDEINTIRDKQSTLLSYLHAYKDQRYYKYLTSLGTFMDVQREFLMNSVEEITKEHWKTALNNKPADLPAIEFAQPPAAPQKPPRRGSLVLENESSQNSQNPETKNPSSPGRPSSINIGVQNSGNEALKSGFLVKRGANRKNWKKRWFVLTSEKFMYFKNTTSSVTNPLGEILLSECSACEICYDWKKDHCFVLKTPKRNYFIYTESNEEMQSWMNSLNQALPGKTSQRETAMDLKEFKTDLVAAPTDWQVYHTEEGYEYWYNEKTGETTWEKPK